MSAIIPYVGLNEVKDEWKDCLKALLAELLGTMFLVLLACGACMQVSYMGLFSGNVSWSNPAYLHGQQEHFPPFSLFTLLLVFLSPPAWGCL